MTIEVLSKGRPRDHRRRCGGASSLVAGLSQIGSFRPENLPSRPLVWTDDMAGPVVRSKALTVGFDGGSVHLPDPLAIVAFVVRLMPVLLGGGLQGLHGYDDSVDLVARALVHGALPYRDFLLLHPPGMILGLSPFAVLGVLTGDRPRRSPSLVSRSWRWAP